MEERKDGDVHTRHCCTVHGCKYGDDREIDGYIECSVTSGRKKQDGPCEDCYDDAAELAARKPKHCPKCRHDVTDL